EVLGRLAHELDGRWPGRVVSVDWGPWRTAGMVSAALEREFERRGVALIGLEQGCRLLERELLCGSKGEAGGVIGAAAGLAAADGASATVECCGLPLLEGAIEMDAVASGDAPGGAPGMHALHTLDLERHRYLGDHRIDGRPVLPFAAAMELMAE